MLDKLKKHILDSHQNWKNHNVSYSYHTGYESEYDDGEGHHNTTGGLFSSFFSRAKKPNNNKEKEKEKVQEMKSHQKLEKIKGVYLFGSPGCGKTFMMDMFFENIDILEKKRVHFNEFMLNIHDQLHRIKSVGFFSFNKCGFYLFLWDGLQNIWGQKSIQDPLSHIAIANAHSCRLLCLDEFQVTDIADALIMRRLFENMLEHNLVLLVFKKNYNFSGSLFFPCEGNIQSRT